MTCPLCNKTMCDHSPTQRGQSSEEMMRDYFLGAGSKKMPKRKKINLVEVRATEGGVGAGCRSQEPIGLSIIGGYLAQKGVDVNIVCSTIQNPDITPERALAGSPDYIGISCFVNDLLEVKSFADRIKRISPLTKVIVGGNGVLTEPAEVSRHPSIDLVVKGEGVYPLEDIINEHSEVRGLVFQNGKLIHNNPTRTNLDETGIPLRTKEMMQNRKRVDLTNPAPSVQKYATLHTSAGCNNHCSFCQTQEMFPGGIRFRDPENVLREVEECQSKYGTNYMLLMDPVAFGGVAGLKSGHAKRCADLLQDTGMRFYALTRLDMPSQYWDILKRAGVSKVGVGIESLIQRGIKDGTPEMQLQKITRYGEEAIKRGILCRGLFMVGYEGQTPDDIKRETESLTQLQNITDIRIGWYNPFEKTQREVEEMYSRGETYTSNISKKDTNHPFLKIQGISEKQAQAVKTNMYRAFYKCGNADDAAKKIVCVDSSLKQSYDEFNRNVLAKIGCQIKYD